jgi:hypothetical protein
VRISRTLLLLVIVGGLIGCGRESRRDAATIDRERFIEANVALRQVPPDTALADSLRHEVLAQHGVSEEDLRAFVLARTDRPAELSAIWEEIHLRMLEQRAAEALPEDEDSIDDAVDDDQAEISPSGPLPETDTILDPEWTIPLRHRIQRTLDTLPWRTEDEG